MPDDRLDPLRVGRPRVGLRDYVGQRRASGHGTTLKKGPSVSSIESQVLQTFLERIAAGGEVSDAVVEGVRDALSVDKLPKAEQLAEIFATGSGDTLA